MSPNGYNLNEGGKGCRHSEETRKKISEANKGQIPWTKGKHHSEETKQKMRHPHKMKKGSGNMGRYKRTKEWGQIISNAKKGKPSPMKGKHLSEKTKQNMRHPKTEEWKEQNKWEDKKVKTLKEKNLVLFLFGGPREN